MGKKLRSYRVLSCTLAVLVAVVFIVACGKGEIAEYLTIKDNVEGAGFNLENVCLSDENALFDCVGDLEEPSSASEPGDQSSASEPSDQSSASDSSSSSDEEQPSSASSPSSSSSSEAEQPASSNSQYRVECKVTKDKGVEYVQIPDSDKPEVKCIENATSNSVVVPSSDVTWENIPGWRSPEKGVFDNIQVKISNSGNACYGTGLVKCAGTLTITAGPSSSSRPPSSASAPSSQSSTPSSSSRSSSSNRASSSSAAASGCTAANNNKYCHYGSKDKCYKMPTDDCCKDGTLVNSCDEAPATAQYCNYGTCVNGSGWNCDSGGCYRMPTQDNCKGGTIVSTCPAGTKPPSADY